MCGIVGAVAQRDVYPILLEGLRILEYRGYDSAGVAVVGPDGTLTQLRRLGKVAELQEAVEASPPAGGLGIAHTRWATHGVPSEANAHPHQSHNRVALVHNGIIENHEVLREALKAEGYRFSSETDTEVIVHSIHKELEAGAALLDAVRATIARLHGAYAIAVVDTHHPDQMVVARAGSPLVIGLGLGENFVASDQLALLPVTRRFIFLEEGDIAQVTRSEISIWNREGQPVERPVTESELDHEAADKGPYRHHMQKEIFEQPKAIADTLEGRLIDDHLAPGLLGPNSEALLRDIEHVQIVACGTSYHAGLVARYWIEDLAGLPCQVEIASEYRYRKTVVPANALFVTISQSGETADTLAALRKAKAAGFRATLAICNVPGSSLVRESDLVLMTRAGAEIGVASTKAFTTQLVALFLLTLNLASQKGMAKEKLSELVRELKHLPATVEQVLKLDGAIEKLAVDFADKEHTLFLGRGTQYPVALEGALKLKEISYIHAEAYPAGELKHGPLALVDANMPVVAVAPNDELLEKLKSNLEEVKARGGRLYLFVAEKQLFEDDGSTVFAMPGTHSALAPVAYTIPLQLLSYHVAVIRGTDVDQPRNLAKSVTVE
jgi:glucosamine--fructose-6-phosphate aminotransferase (isomerizing)